MKIKYIYCSIFTTNIAIIAIGSILLPLCPPVGIMLILGGSLLLLGSIPVMYDIQKNNSI